MGTWDLRLGGKLKGRGRQDIEVRERKKKGRGKHCDVCGSGALRRWVKSVGGF